MGRRLRFAVAQPITITGYLLAGVLLIADMAALASSPTYWLTEQNAPDARHALTSAFYYAIWAAATYMVLGFLMCFTVWGAIHGKYEKEFKLTPPQRTLMLQTMLFITYLLLGALVYCKIEGWEYLNAVYWADITLLTIGFGDYSPATKVGRGLLFPFAIGGILIVGLVIGSIRSLVLERGEEKLSARITEKRRNAAIHNVDERKQTIRISIFASADFSTDPGLSPAQRREEEFNVMRKVQRAAERDRRWFSLCMALSFALLLWFVGAAIFMVAERHQQWTYFDGLYFSFVALLTIGYGDFLPLSNGGRAFFVFWSILAVPSLTILISNMGDTIVTYFTDATEWVGSITVLPGEEGFRATIKSVARNTSKALLENVSRITPAGIFGDIPKSSTMPHEMRLSSDQHEQQMLDRMADRLTKHVEKEELQQARQSEQHVDQLERDMHFYHYVLARECRNVQKDLNASPPKQYSWADWEYYLKLMGNEDDPEDFPGQKQPDILVPEPLKLAPRSSSDAATTDTENKDTNGAFQHDGAQGRPNSDATMTDGAVDRDTELRQWKLAREKRKRLAPHPQGHQSKRHLTTMDLQDWSWLSNKSPLMGTKSEAEWILERLSAALERELNRQRKGYRRDPPVSMSEVHRRSAKIKSEGRRGNAAQSKEAEELEKAAKSAA